MGGWNVAQKSRQRFVGIPEVKNCFVDLDVDGRLILKCMLSK